MYVLSLLADVPTKSAIRPAVSPGNWTASRMRCATSSRSRRSAPSLAAAIARVNKGATPALLINNLFSGSGGPGVSGDYEGSGNLTLPVSSFVDARGDDFRLAARSPAIDSAVGLKGAAVATGAPEFEPVAPLIGQRRRISGDPDIGALEYCRP